jgi:hypothetical protein
LPGIYAERVKLLSHRVQNDGDLAAWLDSIPMEWERSPFACVAVCYSHLQGRRRPAQFVRRQL